MAIIKADFITDEMLEYLDGLRESGVTNMFGAVPYIQEEFKSLSVQQAKAVLSYWMATFATKEER